MGIKFRCHACDKKLHVKAFLAGKRGVCPKCGAKVRIPLANGDTAHAEGDLAHEPPGMGASHHMAAARDFNASGAAVQHTVRTAAPTATGAHASAGSGIRTASVLDPIAEAPEAVWYVRPPTGGQFGPADGTIMRRWLNEGRVSADALVWREGWPDWKSAGPVFPALEGPDLATASLVEPAADEAEEAFSFARPQSPATSRNQPRLRPQPVGRHAAIIGILGVLCVFLLVALVVIMLRAQG